MKLTKQKEKELLKVYDTWLHSYLHGDVETYDFFLDDSYHFIGSTINEELLNRNETTDFFKATADQFAGKTELRNEKKRIEKFGELVILTHVFDGWFLNESEWSYYGRFRFTSTLQEKKEGWRFIYQHFSTTDSKAEEGETIGYDQVSAENLKLREAVKRRTVELQEKNRELEVETALERIRAQAIAMKESSNLLDIVVTMRNEFIKLGHEAHYFWHMMWLPETYEKAMTSGDGSKIGFVMELPRHIHGDIPLLAKWEKSKKPTVVYAMNVQEALDYVGKMVSLGDFQNIDPQAPTEDDIRHIGGLTFIMARTSHGEIGFSLPGIVKNPPKEDIDILVKFAGAFDLAHQRFLDLQKAEKQARETQIELGLERVRSSAMAMQKSEELSDLVNTVFTELKKLDFALSWCIINIIDEPSLSNTRWGANPEIGKPPESYHMKFEDYRFHHEMMSAYQARLLKWVFELEGQEKEDYEDYLFSQTEFRRVPESVQNEMRKSKKYVASFTFSSFGGLQTIGEEPLSEANLDILRRFGKVFDLTYTRFNDLLKAEAQAREAQIETALEKVRSRTMAMQQSDELPEAANNLFLQVQALGIPAWSAGYCIWEDTNKKSTSCNMSSEGEIQKGFSLPTIGEGYNFSDPLKNGDSFHVAELGGKKLMKHYDFMKTLPIIGEVLADFDKKGISLPTFQIFHIVYFTHGYLMFITYEPVPNDWDIFKRFGKVFEQTYTRFLDLKRAEAQAREAQIETALEKVRSRSLAMHKPNELQEVVAVVAEKLHELGVIFDAGGVILCTYFPDNKDVMHWISAPDFSYSGNYLVPYFDNPIFNDAWDSKIRGDAYFSQEFSVAVKNSFFSHCFAHSDYKNFPDEFKQHALQAKKHHLSAAWSKNSAIIIPSLTGLIPSVSDAEIMKRFSKVFEQAYIRFMDLQKAEFQAREAQIEAALERVRSKTMAMHNSEDVGYTVVALFDEVMKLGLDKSIRCGLGILENREGMETWSANLRSNGEVLLKFGMLNMSIHPMLVGLKKAWKSGKKSYSYDYIGEDVYKYYEALNNEPEYEFNANLDTLPENEYHNSFFFSSGILFAFTENPMSEEASQVLDRFSDVFGQTYRRYLDLLKAEEQAKEAQIEAALEKVRARTMAMQASDELRAAANLLFLEIQGLGINAWSAGYNILSSDKTKSICN